MFAQSYHRTRGSEIIALEIRRVSGWIIKSRFEAIYEKVVSSSMKGATFLKAYKRIYDDFIHDLYY
ncbi:hypothetical protein [Borrelia sp. P9F1]|uniref:hypothetical protein n=1 Tax=Borrelia sp. P9F1 TaxID=3058374 RepID=UPI002647D94B|nr:hypothetical protein [Borrelia sp. P9F1]WKC58389.1 hypothetical protein QYZ68_04445 [Borrelia sp. P9F1]